MGDKSENDQMVREFMQKNKRLQDERDDLNSQIKGLMSKMNTAKEEIEDARMAAAAANADKANVEKDWSTRLIKSEKEWAARLKKLQDERDEALSGKDTDFARKLEESKASFEAALAKAKSDSAMAAEAMQSEHRSNMAELKASMQLQLEKAQNSAKGEQARLDALCRQQLSEKNQQLQEQLSSKDREHARQTTELQSQWRRQMDELQTKFATERAVLVSDHRRKLEDSEAASLKRYHEMEEAWKTKVAEATSTSEASALQLKKELDGQVDHINRQLQDLVLRESKRERKRATLSAEVESLRESSEEEFRRRCELEKALREAASLFKRELYEKNEEVSSLQHDLHAMQVWHERALLTAELTQSKATIAAYQPPAPTKEIAGQCASPTRSTPPDSLHHHAPEPAVRSSPDNRVRGRVDQRGGYPAAETPPMAMHTPSTQTSDVGNESLAAIAARSPAGVVHTFRPAVDSRESAVNMSLPRCADPSSQNVDFDSWHQELSQRLDHALHKLAPPR